MAADKTPNHPITGLVAATFCPFTEQGQVNYDLIPRYVDYLHENGVQGVFVNGSTGEGVSLSTAERQRVAEEWVKHAKGKLQHVIVHVGSCSLPDAKVLAKHAVDIGATGVACVPPFYYKVTELEGIVEFLSEVAACCRELPFYFYHFPDMTAVRISAKTIFEALSAARIPNLAGMKFTAADIKDARAVAGMEGGRFQCLIGFDELYLSWLANGLGSGAIGAFHNFMPKVMNRINAAFQKGDLEQARLEQERVQKAIFINMKYTTGLVCREFMEFVGLDMGPPRPPLTSLTPEKKAAMRRELEELGFFQWIL